MPKTKKVPITESFNVLHAEHLSLFRFTKVCGDRFVLIVKARISRLETAPRLTKACAYALRKELNELRD